MSSSKVKILFILHYPPPVHGAAMVGKFIRESEQINNTFICRYINLGTSQTIDEIGRGDFKKWWRYLLILWSTFFEVLSFKPELVYLTPTSTGGGFYKDALVALIVKGIGKKVVYHFHNKGIRTRQNKFFDNWLYKLVFKNADVILLSEHLYPDIEKYVSKDQVHYCPNGIPEIKQYPINRDERKPGKVEILFLSNLIETKGVSVLLEACKLLQEKKIDFHCAFVGGEGDITAEQFQHKIDISGLSEYVIYAGKKYGLDKEKVFVETDIFALPTYYNNECFPLVLLEAMQFSLPVISTYEGGIPEIVKEGATGFLVPQKNAEVLAEKLEVLIKNPGLRIKFGAAGRRKYEQEFTLEVFEERFTNILKKLV